MSLGYTNDPKPILGGDRLFFDGDFLYRLLRAYSTSGLLSGA
jgi:hypothetical protein